MPKSLRSMTSHVVLLAIAFAAPIVASAQAQPQQSKSDSSQGTNAPAATVSQSSDYVGSETCKACHEDIYNSWEKTPHWKTTLDTKGGPSHQGCEGCHGPGAAHVAGGGDITKIFIFKKHSTKEINERCLTCHASGTQHMHAINSVHAKKRRQLHLRAIRRTMRKKPEFLLVKAQPELCYSCHLQQKPQFDMPFHHRVNEGLVQCTRLPQSARHGRGQAGAHLGGAGRRLLHLPRRQARAVRVRA